MRSGTRLYTVVAPSASVHVDDHSALPVEQPFFYQEFEQSSFNTTRVQIELCIDDRLAELVSWTLDLSW